MRTNINIKIEFIDEDDKQVPNPLFDLPWDIERCGYLVGQQVEDTIYVTRVVQLWNRHPQPEKFYEISKRDFEHSLDKLALRKEAVKVFWHTHVAGGSPDPSYQDCVGIEPYIGLMVNVRQQTATIYDRNGYINKITKENA